MVALAHLATCRASLPGPPAQAYDEYQEAMGRADLTRGIFSTLEPQPVTDKVGRSSGLLWRAFTHAV